MPNLANSITIGRRTVGAGAAVYVIAELACAHEGDFNFAQRWIDAAATTGADAVKFQVFTADGLVVATHELHAAYRRFEFTRDQWQALAEQARASKLDLLVDVFEPWSLTVAQAIAADALKVHSTNVTNPYFLEQVAAVGLPVLIGAGGTTRDEIAAAVGQLTTRGVPIAILHGFQGYPTATADAQLNRIRALAADFGVPVGFAGHADGAGEGLTRQNLVSLGLGCAILENHLTLDRSPTRTDYHSALLPDDFRRMVHAVRETEAALGAANYELPAAEARYRGTFKTYIVSARDLPAGHTLASGDLAFKRSAHGLLPVEAGRFIGRRLARNIARDEPLSDDLFAE